MVYKNNKKGAQGIGTLIIFIAMILVAAVAAGVLIQTASNLQSKALDVGAQSQQRVTTALDIVSVRAVNNDTGSYNVLNASVDTIEMVLRLASGSSPIKLEDLKIQFDTKDSSTILKFNVTSKIANAVNYEYGTAFGKSYIEVGDTVTVDFYLTQNVTESENLKILLMPKDGTPIPVDVTTPNVMTTKIISLR